MFTKSAQHVLYLEVNNNKYIDIQCILAQKNLQNLEEIEKAIKLCVKYKFSVSQVCAIFSINKTTLYHKVKTFKKEKVIQERKRKKILDKKKRVSLSSRQKIKVLKINQ